MSKVLQCILFGLVKIITIQLYLVKKHWRSADILYKRQLWSIINFKDRGNFSPTQWCIISQSQFHHGRFFSWSYCPIPSVANWVPIFTDLQYFTHKLDTRSMEGENNIFFLHAPSEDTGLWHSPKLRAFKAVKGG